MLMSKTCCKKISMRAEIIILRDCTNSFRHLSSNEFLD